LKKRGCEVEKRKNLVELLDGIIRKLQWRKLRGLRWGGLGLATSAERGCLILLHQKKVGRKKVTLLK